MSNRARTTLSFFISILLICCTIVAISYFKKSEEDYSNYSITLDAIGTNLDNTTITPNADGTISLPTPTKDGYTFDGWYVDGTKWVQDMVITEDMTLTARWTPVKYNITFVVNNVSTIVQVDHNTIPEYIGELEKPNTAYYTYSFSNWLPAIEPATKDMTYTAVFNAVKTTYDITLSSNIHSAGNLVGAGCYEYQSNITITATTNNGYLFDGWYYEGFLYTTDNSFTLNNISKNFAFEARYSIIDYSITYHSIYNIPHSNITSYTVLDSDFTLQGLDKYGYTFMGWYTEDGGAGNKITTIDCSLAREYDLYAYFVITNYTITYNLDGGNVSGTNPSNYTIETNTFTLINPTKNDHEFIGWTGTGITTMTTTVTVSIGSTGNKTFTANWKLLSTTITFKTGDATLDDITITAKPGTTISAPTVVASNYNMTGYTLNGWYSDTALTTKYTFNKMPESNITLYGSWDYFIDEGFYPYLEEFNKASTTTTTIINSFDELVAFVEYISFNYITRAYPFKIVYTTPSNSIVSNAINESTYPTNCTISYTTTYVYLGSNNKDSEGTLTADPSKSHITAEQNYSMLTTLDSNRAANNTNFNINTVNKTLSVYSTNQLMYALEKGLRPVCEPNSPAERIYSKAKTILNEICDDNMTDFEKIKAIYDWLILNVQYDHYAVANYTNSWENYDAWFAEGVFDKGVAVCDGISKALLILAKIENIPAVRTTSTNHAWNKVYINGNWYGIDATHGDVSMGDTGMNYLTYNNFLFTDIFKLSQSQNDTQYDELVANTVYNYYENANYTYNDTTFDLEINSQTEFNTLLKYLKSFTPTTTNYSFEFTLASGFAPTINTLITNGKSQTGFSATNISYAQLDYSTGQTVYLIIVTP